MLPHHLFEWRADALLGDDVAINHDCTLQTRQFEDRVVKMSAVEIGAGCHLGSMSLILHDTRLEPGSSVDDLPLVMKGETLPADAHATGIPGRRLEQQRFHGAQ